MLLLVQQTRYSAPTKKDVIRGPWTGWVTTSPSLLVCFLCAFISFRCCTCIPVASSLSLVCLASQDFIQRTTCRERNTFVIVQVWRVDKKRRTNAYLVWYPTALLFTRPTTCCLLALFVSPLSLYSFGLLCFCYFHAAYCFAKEKFRLSGSVILDYYHTCVWSKLPLFVIQAKFLLVQLHFLTKNAAQRQVSRI